MYLYSYSTLHEIHKKMVDPTIWNLSSGIPLPAWRPHMQTHWQENNMEAPFIRVSNRGHNQSVCEESVWAEEKTDLAKVEGVDLVVVQPVHLDDLHIPQVPLHADREVKFLPVLQS